jgi:hypothetical protein
MNQLAAMRETLTRAQACGMADISGFADGCEYWHLQDMVERAEAAMRMPGMEFSDAKLGRWLGWMQCAVVAAAIGLTLEDMKEINRLRAADGGRTT